MIYEINFLVLQSKTAELEKIRKESKEFIKSFGAEIIEEKIYLKRKLAYEIQHENYGFFTVLRFEFKKATNLDELKIKLNQKIDIARYIIIQAEGLSSLEEQAAKDLEKTQDERKSIKSEDVEKILTEQKKAIKEKIEAKEKPAVTEKIKKTKEDKTVAEEDSSTKDAEEKIIKVAKPKKKVVTKKEKKIKEVEETEENKEAEEKEKKEEVSLDELDKKLDEILNS